MNSVQNENKPLPDFLKDDLPQSGNLKNEAQHMTSPLRKIFTIISGLWLFLVVLYIQFSFGWSGLSALLPSEFASFLAGVFIPLALILLIVVFIYRAFLTANQAALVEKSLGQILYSKDGNILSQILNQSLQKQIQELTSTALNISKQTGLLKNEMNAKAEDFTKISAIIENCFTENLQKLDTGTAHLVEQCQMATDTAGKSAELFSIRAEDLKNSAKGLNDELNPLINETLITAEHLKTILDESKEYIAQSNSHLADFTKNSHKNLEDLAQILDNQSSKLEKTFLQTADNCEEIYKRLDTGISHIENSIKNHKELAAEQSALLDKNSSFLDSKLGEYGRLISLEVEAMVERSSTLDMNVKNQLNTLTTAREKIDQILDGANNSLEQKSGKAVLNIEKIITNLDTELIKLNEFIKKTENKNTEIQSAAEKITRKIGDISSDLGQKVDDLKTRAIEAIDKFNEVSGVVQKNTLQLSETANTIVSKGKEGAESLEIQHSNISQTVQKLEGIKTRIGEIEAALNNTSGNTAKVFEDYKVKIADFGSLINKQVELLNESQTHSEEQLFSLKKQYDELSTGNFMDESAGLIENLENIAIDINSFFNNGQDDELWKKFYNGDHAVFTRHIIKNLNRKQIVKIREEYEKNADFRQLSDRYIREFEMLLSSARNAEKPETLLAMLSGSDIGKIYYIMARALNRLD